MKILRYACVGALGAVMVFVARDASANNLDLDPGDSYPTAVGITSPAGYDSLFTFNNTFAIGLSDSNFNIDANFNGDGTLNSFNSVTITSGIDTGLRINTTQPVYATLEWQSGSGSNNAHLNALGGDVEITLVFKINFTGPWKGGSETCRTGAFTVDMGTSASYTYPYTGGTLHGSSYSSSSHSFRVVSNSFIIPAITGTSCQHTNDLTQLGAGTGSADSGMKIDPGFPTYDYDGQPVHGS